MYQIKQKPEDFVVDEISNIKPSNNGSYSYFKLKKTGFTTQYALQILSDKIKKPLKYFGFAGNKDKEAITTQNISIHYGSKNIEKFEFKGLHLEYLGSGNQPISLGDLEGNKFNITLRNLTIKDIEKLQKTKSSFLSPNYFGPQRFSAVNHLIGKSIIKKEFSQAVKLILEFDKGNRNIITQHLENNKNDFIGAIRLIPLRTRKIYVHAYQSLLFNKILNKEKKKTDTILIPIIGFGTDLTSEIKKYLDKENVSERDFIIPSIPELSSEGTTRKAFTKVKDFKIIDILDDDLNKEMKKAEIEFTLSKGCYATVVIDYLLENCKNILDNII